MSVVKRNVNKLVQQRFPKTIPLGIDISGDDLIETRICSSYPVKGIERKIFKVPNN